MVLKMNVSEKIKCEKLTNFIFVILRDVFENIYSFVEERTVKQNHLTIMKT